MNGQAWKWFAGGNPFLPPAKQSIRQEGTGVNKGFSGHGLKTVLDLDCKNGVVRRSWFHR